MESYEKIKKVLALGFMNFLDENKPKDKMCLSNGECADIEKAFNEKDWPKLARYLDKYTESEDERIMRCIGLALTDVNEQRFNDFGITLKDCLSWLEKKKVLTEHKEGIYYYHRDGTFTFISHPAVENPHNFTVPRSNEKSVDYDHEMWKNCEANFEDGKKEVIDHPKKYGLQKEQKPADKEQDSIAFLEQHGYTIVPPHAPVSIVPSSEATFTEWSEEDKANLNNIIWLCENCERGIENVWIPSQATQIKNLIKSLRPQPKQEWSEEDGRILKGIIGKIDHDQTYGVSKDEMLNFLKKL